MKLLYFGTVCNQEQHEKLLCRCRVRPSVAPRIFESALLTGFAENGADLEVHSFPSIAAFPNAPLLCWGARKETVDGGYSCRWLPCVNLPVLKQLSRRLASAAVLRRALRRDAHCAVLLYSVYEPVAQSILHACKKYGAKCYVIIPDLPADLYLQQGESGLMRRLKKRFIQRACAIQGAFDGYIYLTEAMRKVVNPQAPSIVMEGIADTTAFDGIAPVEKKRAVMYAGAINVGGGVEQLIQAFRRLDCEDWELWLFGSGTYDPQKDAMGCARIRCFGAVSREEVLRREREAALLVNPRPTDAEYTRYSFPSKTIESMLSGTPLLTTRLAGIPEDYFNHMYSVADNRPETLERALREIFAHSDEERQRLGASAREFIRSRCAAKHQAGRILRLIEENRGEGV